MFANPKNMSTTDPQTDPNSVAQNPKQRSNRSEQVEPMESVNKHRNTATIVTVSIEQRELIKSEQRDFSRSIRAKSWADRVANFS